MNRLNELLSVVPNSPEFAIDWELIESTVMRVFAAAMRETQQNPKYHAEGDVWAHTKLVCESLVKDSEFQALSDRQRQELFLGALFHDVGKISTTRLDDNGEWTSPNHAIVGANLIRDLLWREYGLCGEKSLQGFREAICFLVRYHMIVPYVLESENADYRFIKTAANGELASDFTLELLFLLSKADCNGKKSSNSEKEDNTILAAELAKEIYCFNKPRSFTNAFTEYAYFSGKNIRPESALYNDAKFEVILLCGLPGTGKDTWIKKTYPDYPVVCLDDIRREFGISPVGNQQEVVRIAKFCAKQLLRENRSFVWNATSITSDIRSRLISLFTAYHAYVKLVFLETEWNENLRRNINRTYSVPQSVIEKMLTKLEIPERFEAHEVNWLCI